MADVVKAEGLILAYTDGSGNTYPLACAKDASLSISRDVIELAPKSFNNFRRYIPGKRNFTINGSGLVKLSGTYQHPFSFFSDLFTTTDTNYVGYLDIIDNQNNYKVYKFNCYITNLTLDAEAVGFANYSYSLQGNGPFTEITEVDSAVVTSGTVPGRDTASWKLVAVGYNGKWYYNYTVNAGPVIDLGTSLNGVTVKSVYILV